MASSGAPANGISSILFVIQRNGPNGPGSDRVPASLTCFRQPLLPEYSTRKRRKKKKLELALESGKGFDVPLGVVFCFFSFPPAPLGVVFCFFSSPPAPLGVLLHGNRGRLQLPISSYSLFLEFLSREDGLLSDN